MYGLSQTRAYPYAPRNAVPRHSAPAAVPTSYPYSSHKRAESHAYTPQRSISPSVVRSRPRATSAAAPGVNPAYAGISGNGSANQKYSNAYYAGAGSSSRDSSTSRQRSHTQPRPQVPSQPRPRTPYSQANSYPYASWPQTSSAQQRHQATAPIVPPLPTSKRGPVIPDAKYLGRSEESSRGRPAVSTAYRGYESGMYASGRADGVGQGYRHEQDSSKLNAGRSAPGSQMPYAGTRYPTQQPMMYGQNMHAPPRPPSPASHYPFANYRRPDGDSSDSDSDEELPSRRRDNYSRPRRSSDARNGLAAPPYAAVASSQADSTASDPLIHPALGWWPDQRRPALYWDLSSSARPRYTKREFDADELASSPFSPPLRSMRIVLDPQYRWAFDLSTPRGQEYITLSSLLKDITSLMRVPNMVPHVFWVRASTSRKEAILRAYLKRTGRTLAVPPLHRRPKPRGQIMEEAVVEGAPKGYTNLLVIDLMCDDVMFNGLEFHKDPDEWLLRTTRRYS